MISQPVPSTPFALANAASSEATTFVEEVVQDPAEADADSGADAQDRDELGRFAGEGDADSGEAAAFNEAADAAAGDSSALIEEATSLYGLPQALAEKLGDGLPEYLAVLDRQASQLMRDREAGRQERPHEESHEEQQPAAAKPSPIPQLDELKLTINPEDHPDDMVADVQNIAGTINKQGAVINQLTDVLKAIVPLLAETHTTVTKSTEHTQQEQFAARTRDLDEVFAGLPDELTDTYGKAPLSHLPPASPLLTNRNKLIEEMHFLEQADKLAGRAKASTKQYAQRALRFLHSDAEHAAARRDVAGDLAKRRKVAISRPNALKSRQPSPRQKAVAAVAEKLAAAGLGSL